MTKRLFMLKTCAKVAGFWVWMAVLGLVSPHRLLQAGVRFEKTEDGFKMTYESVE